MSDKYRNCGVEICKLRVPRAMEKLMAVKLSYGRVFVYILVLTVLFCSGYVLAANGGADSGPARYRVFPLRNISAEEGKKYLAEARIGTVSQLPGSNTLLVTANPRELIKASAVLKLVDAKEKFVIKAVFPAAIAKNLPSNDKIAAEVGNISIGTFSESPTGNAAAKAIIDIHNDNVMVVAPAEQFEKIVSVIKQALILQEGSKTETEQLPRTEGKSLRAAEAVKSVEPNRPGELKAETVEEAEPAKTPFTEGGQVRPERMAESSEAAGRGDANESKEDELFGELLGSLAKTEKMAVEPAQQASQPNEPNTVAGVPEQAAPGEAFAAEQAREPNVAAIAEESAAEKPSVEPEVKAEIEAEPEEVRVEAEQPGKVAEPTAAFLSYKPEPIATGDEELTLDLPEKLNVIDLLDLVGKYLNLDYMYDSAEVKGDVTLKIQGPIKVKDLYPLLESVLKFRGFVMARKGNLVTIVKADSALNIDPALLNAEKGKIQYGDVIVTRIFDLNYIDTTSATNLLKEMKLGTNITPIAATGTLIVTEYAYRMARIEEILTMIDRPGEPKQFRYRQLKYTMAKTLAPKIKTLVEQMGGMSVTIAKPEEAQPPPARRGRPAAQPEPSPQPSRPTVYLDADERTNRILMIGLKNELAVVEKLIDSLDVAQQDLRSFRLYEIQHVGAEEVVKKLGELGIIKGGQATARPSAAPTAPSAPSAPPRSARAEAAAGESATAGVVTEGGIVEEPQVVVIESTNSLLVNATPEQHIQIATIISYVDSETLTQAIPYVIYGLENQDPEGLAEVLQKFIQETIKDKEGKIQQTIKKTEENIIIVPDKNTFSILVYASKKNQEWIGSLIKQLDKRRPQVLIDVMLVGISEVDSFTYDLQLVSKLPEMAAGGQMQKLADPLLPTFPSNTVKEVTSILSDTGGGQGFYADSHIQALLKLMQKKGYGRVLARPKILVNDNEKGHIDTTKTIYVSRSATTVQTNVGGTGTPISTSYTFDQFPSGIKLDITPHISEGSLLRLELQLSRSNQTPPAGTTADLPPGDKTEDNVNTVVTVPDNSTIILGGIITLDQGKTNWKVPFLGDIPIAGGLFRKISNSSNQTKLYVFVKANILRPDDTVAGLADLRKISDRNRAAVEGFEERFQKHQDWPGIEPEPIDPLKVLESE
jgi:general secretion pathway protein D